MIGFVYLWFDRARCKFYLGSHLGSEEDRYLGGSLWFRNAYRKRPQDFRRRIIERIFYGGVKEIRDAENRWLSFIRQDELGRRYYNLKIAAIGFDSTMAVRIAKAQHFEKDANGKSIIAVQRGTIGSRIAHSKKNSEGKSLVSLAAGAARALTLHIERTDTGGSAFSAKGGRAAHATKDENGKSLLGIRSAKAAHAKKTIDGKSITGVKGALGLHAQKDSDGKSLKARQGALKRWNRDRNFRWWTTLEGVTYTAPEPRNLNDKPGRNGTNLSKKPRDTVIYVKLGKLAAHNRWHLGRDMTSDLCEFCRIAA